MAMNNTRNPVPSRDPCDGQDNLQALDEFSNSSDPLYRDRLGQQHMTLEGWRQKATLDLDGAVAQATEEAEGYRDDAEGFKNDAKQSADDAAAAASASGPIYAFPATYADAVASLPDYPEGVNIQVLRDETNNGDRVQYKVESGALVEMVNLDYAVNQLRADLANGEQAGKGAGMVAKSAISVDSISALASIPAAYRRADQRYLVASGGEYSWDGTKFNLISNSARPGDFEGISDAIAASRSRRLIVDAETYRSEEQIKFPAQYFNVSGQGRATKIEYTGAAARSFFEVDSSGDASEATLNSELSGLVVDGKGADFTDALINLVYLSRFSKVNDLDVYHAGAGPAMRIAKAWYLSLGNNNLTGATPYTPGSVGLKIDCTVNQVNDVLISKQGLRSFETGLLVDTSTGSTFGSTFVLPTIESCKYGIRFVNDVGNVSLMNFFGGYLEANEYAIYINEPTSISTQVNVNYIGLVFTDNSGVLYLGRGNHTFTGCRGIREIYVGATARVTINGNAGLQPVIHYLSGADRRNVRINILPIYATNFLSYGSQFGRQDVASTVRIRSSSISGMRVPIPVELLNPRADGGRAVHVRMVFRRDYSDANGTFYREFLLMENGSGGWYVKNINFTDVSQFSADVDAGNGDLLISWGATDIKTIDIKYSPY